LPAGPAPRPRWGCAAAVAGAPPRVGPPRARPPPPHSTPPTPTTGARGPSPPHGCARRAPTVAPRRRFTDASPGSDTSAAAMAAPARPPARRFEMGSRVHVRRGVVSSVPDRGGQTPRAGVAAVWQGRRCRPERRFSGRRRSTWQGTAPVIGVGGLGRHVGGPLQRGRRADGGTDRRASVVTARFTQLRQLRGGYIIARHATHSACNGSTPPHAPAEPGTAASRPHSRRRRRHWGLSPHVVGRFLF